MSSYDMIATAGEGFKKRLYNAIRNNLPFIILVFNIVGYAATKLFDTQLVNPFTPDYFAALTTNLLSSAVTYACFMQYGERMGKATIDGYGKAVAIWSEMSGRVRSSLSAEFVEHCKARLEAEREERRVTIILNNTTMSSEQYLSTYRTMSREQLKKLKKSGGITAEEYRAIKRANGNIKIKPINPLLILCGVKSSHINDAGRDGVSYATINLISRPLLTFVLTALVAMFRGPFIGVTDTAVICDIIYVALMIVVASFTGYSAGMTSAHRDFDKIKGRVFFLEDFLKNKA